MSRMLQGGVREELPEKVVLMYNAVMELLAEGEDLSQIKVSSITSRAGIGKGTAYDYFDSKEEIIVEAIVFHMEKFAARLEQSLRERDGFSEKILCLLDKVEEEASQKRCFWSFVHLISDTTGLSQMLHTAIEEQWKGRNILIDVLQRLLQEGVTHGEVRKDLPIDYMIFTLTARLLTYMGTILSKDSCSTSPKQMRSLVYQGILEELRSR